MRYFLQRLFQFVIVFVVVTFVVMAATRIGSTDPLRDLAGGQVSELQMEEVAEDYPYLDKPLPVQYVYWLQDVFTGDWGRSYIQSQTVGEMFRQRAPATFFIVFWAIVIGLVIAVPLGVYSAYRRDKFFDKTSSVELVRRHLDAAARGRRAVAVLGRGPRRHVLHRGRIDLRRALGQPRTSTSRTSSYPRSRSGSVSARYGAASFAAT